MFATFLHDNRELVVLVGWNVLFWFQKEQETVNAAQPVLDAVLSCAQRVDRFSETSANRNLNPVDDLPVLLLFRLIFYQYEVSLTPDSGLLL